MPFFNTDLESGAIVTNVMVVLGLVTVAGIAAGLTLGMFSLDIMKLKILTKQGTIKEQKYAKRLIPILENQHLLLVSLLLVDVACSEALPLFIHKLFPSEITAIIFSVGLMLMFGEILPQ
eukprot:gene12620-3702_t